MSRRQESAAALAFRKMHGLGNDFILLDARHTDLRLTDRQAAMLADRRLGIGADQVLTLTRSDRADVFVRFQNVDGREAQACGNATRCVARFLFDESGRDEVRIETVAGLLEAWIPEQGRDEGTVAVDMGVPKLAWGAIPLARATDTAHLPLVRSIDGEVVVADGVAVNMGNPHAVFFVGDLSSLPLDRFGAELERDPLFPEGANIGFAQIVDRERIRLRVWERSAGLTPACGTGACAATVAAVRRGLTARCVAVEVDGGRLHIEWQQDGHVLMTGPTAFVFSGEVSDEYLRLLLAADAARPAPG